MKKLLALFTILSIVSVITITYLLAPETRNVDSRTHELCKWYASLDHEKEFSPERWATNKEWIQEFDWYGSCIDHVKYPVAK